MRFLCLATFVLAITASSASAATPFTAGAGNEPAVVVGTDGTGHVAWQVTGSDTKVGYCRVTAQAGACNRTEPLSFPGGGGANDAGRPQVFAPSAGRVVIVATCSQCGTPSDTTNRTYRWTSSDNGGSFGAPAEVGRGSTTGGFGTLLADESFVGVEGSEAKAAELTGAAPVQFTSFVTTFGSDIVRDTASNQLVAVTNNLSVIRNGAFRGATLSVAEINNSSNWVADQGLIGQEPANRGQSLAAGPRGVFMAYESSLGSDERAGLRKYNPAIWAFGSPTYVEGADPIDADPDYVDSFQDAAGRLHLAWLSLHDGGRLRYRVSDTAGNNLSAAANLAAHDSFVEPELGAGGDGRGFATWTSGGEVRVVALDPQPEPVAPGGQTPDPVPPITPPDPRSGTTYSGPTRARVTRVPGASITFTAPRGCVARGQRFRVRLVWKRQKRKGNLFVKIFRTDFYVGRKIVKTDRRVPFVQTLTVAAGTTPGSTVTVRARAFIKVKHGRGPKKSIATTLRVCS
jgi:hypothetical protein